MSRSSSIGEDVPMAPARAAITLGGRTLLLARIASAGLALFFAILLVYTIATAGSPFQLSLLTPWMATTIVDYYVTALPFYVWIFIRERSAGLALLYALICAGLGSSLVWIYILVALLQHRSGQPLASFVLGASYA